MKGTRRTNPVRLQSWIPPSFVWTTANVFCVEASINDSNLVEFIATGVEEILVTTKEAAQMVDRLVGHKSLFGQLQEAISPSAKLKSKPERTNVEVKISVFCHGVFLLPDEKHICVVVGREEPRNQNGWISTELKTINQFINR